MLLSVVAIQNKITENSDDNVNFRGYNNITKVHKSGECITIYIGEIERLGLRCEGTEIANGHRKNS